MATDENRTILWPFTDVTCGGAAVYRRACLLRVWPLSCQGRRSALYERPFVSGDCCSSWSHVVRCVIDGPPYIFDGCVSSIVFRNFERFVVVVVKRRGRSTWKGVYVLWSPTSARLPSGEFMVPWARPYTERSRYCRCCGRQRMCACVRHFPCLCSHCASRGVGALAMTSRDYDVGRLSLHVSEWILWCDRWASVASCP